MLADAVLASPVDWAAMAIAAARRSDIRRYITPMLWTDRIGRRAQGQGLTAASQSPRPSALSLVVAVCCVLCMTTAPVLAASRLIDAVKRGDVNAVRTLIAQKADVNAPDADGSTPLHWATQRDDTAMAEALIAAGANVKAKTRYNVTPLSLASASGDAKLIDRLLKAGADPNETAEEGQTALMTASLTGKPDAVRLLLETGANVNAVEPYKGQTALMWAASEGNTAAAE